MIASDTCLQKLEASIERAARLLPLQGPLGEFAFLNPLQGLEHLPFTEGLERGARLYGCSPYLPKSVYRAHLSSGRILLDDLKTTLQREMGTAATQEIKPSGTRFDLRLAMLVHPLPSAPTEELRWFIAETNALRQFGVEVPSASRAQIVAETKAWVFCDRTVIVPPEADITSDTAEEVRPDLVNDLIAAFDHPDIESWDARTWDAFSLHALWRVCRDGLAGVEPPRSVRSTTRHRNLLIEAGYDDTDLWVHPLLIRFCSAFTDQGLSGWELPRREQGFFRAFINLYSVPGTLTAAWMRTLSSELLRMDREQVAPRECIRESLVELGVSEEKWDDCLESTLLALPGWAGLVWQLESRPDRSPKPVPVGSLLEFVAIRLLLERTAFQYVYQQQKTSAPSLAAWFAELNRQKHLPPAMSVEQRVFYLFQLSQLMGWSSQRLSELSGRDWAMLTGEIEAFPSLVRRRMFHMAYERRFRSQLLNAITCRSRQRLEPEVRPRFQSVFCLDAREESLRRHLDEQSSAFETFGTAGFFGVAMYFRGAADSHFSAYCPVVIRPKNWVEEIPAAGFEKSHESRAKARRLLGLAAHRIHVDTRSLGPGAILSAAVGMLASVPFAARILFPEYAARLRQAFGKFFTAPVETRLALEGTGDTERPSDLEPGFTVEEMALIGEKLLRDIGLTANFGRLIFLIGHGSACQNNTHLATYHCGACTGKPGGQNSRAVSTMLNHPQVRTRLASRGLLISDETIFVAGLHNTCDDTIAFYDLDQLPKSHLEDFRFAKQLFEKACRQNAHERCRRFHSAPLTISPEQAHRHVKRRSEDLAQTRPEFGNATNAVCIVGRRQRTRGLFLDRRAFLQSYDPTQDDPEFTILSRILAAVVPVCSGINMTYNLSALDPAGWGCGTKLPHNITSLLGVMDGASSDLRSGLPAQGVEIHEPLRLLFVLETTQAAIVKIMRENPTIGRILQNEWAQLAVLDPDSDRIQIYEKGEFRVFETTVSELARAGSSAEWYRGSRENLGFALIGERGRQN